MLERTNTGGGNDSQAGPCRRFSQTFGRVTGSNNWYVFTITAVP